MTQALLQSIQVGMPGTFGSRDALDPLDQEWTSGFYKAPVAGPVHIGATNIVGDGQADLAVHGGVDKAVLAYSADHYPAWRALLDLPELGPGAFGENLTIANITESDVCIGDRFQCGEAILEVTQPRQPCWKLARRWRLITLPKLVVQTGRSGWYLRVVREGEVAAGAAFTLVQRPHPSWTIERANSVMHGKLPEPAERAELAGLPELSASWRAQLSRK
jgi:MOSC domain-containing protein YiiM